ncbi:hypothetical protein Holit_02165 [Hollandina sp. SP2]
MRKRIQELGISYGMVATDDRDRFLSAFGEDNQVIGKEHTGDRGEPLPTEAQGTEGISEDLLFFEAAVQPAKRL